MMTRFRTPLLWEFPRVLYEKNPQFPRELILSLLAVAGERKKWDGLETVMEGAYTLARHYVKDGMDNQSTIS